MTTTITTTTSSERQQPLTSSCKGRELGTSYTRAELKTIAEMSVRDHRSDITQQGMPALCKTNEAPNRNTVVRFVLVHVLHLLTKTKLNPHHRHPQRHNRQQATVTKITLSLSPLSLLSPTSNRRKHSCNRHNRHPRASNRHNTLTHVFNTPPLPADPTVLSGALNYSLKEVAEVMTPLNRCCCSSVVWAVACSFQMCVTGCLLFLLLGGLELLLLVVWEDVCV